MPRHHFPDLTLPAKIIEFLDALIPTPSLLNEFFQKYNLSFDLNKSNSPFSAVTQFLDNLSDPDLKDTIIEKIARLYDIAKKSPDFISDAIQKYQIATTGKENTHQLVMDIFLHHKSAYDYLNDYHLLFKYANKMSRHKMECPDFVITEEKKERFKEQIRKYYQDKQQGRDCIIRYHPKDSQLVIWVIRGKHKKSQMVLKESGGEVDTDFLHFRPAYEDILQYDSKTYFSVYTSRSKDRVNYINAFAEHILGDRSQASRPDRDVTYTLKPLQNKTFSYGGNDVIKSIILIEVTMKISGSTVPTIYIESSDINRTFDNDITGLDLNSGELVSAKFLFVLEIKGKTKEVTFEITPPSSTDLGIKKYNEIISEYLVANGIKKV